MNPTQNLRLSDTFQGTILSHVSYLLICRGFGPQKFIHIKRFLAKSLNFSFTLFVTCNLWRQNIEKRISRLAAGFVNPQGIWRRCINRRNYNFLFRVN